MANKSRRSFLETTAKSGAALLAGVAGIPVFGKGVAEPACKLDVELTQGPYYLDREILRRNITESKPGVPLKLQLRVVDAASCQPVPNAAVEIWHCDASGVYSGFTKMSPDSLGGMPSMPGQRGDRQGPPPSPTGEDGGMPPPPPGGENMGPFGGGSPPGGFPHPKPDKTTFCRGVQIADASGQVEFETIYPGWYVSRDTHIHLKVHIGGKASGEKYTGGRVAHTGQLFFPDELTDQIAKLEPYSRHRLERTKLEEDNVYASSHGTGPILQLTPANASGLESGMTAAVTLHVDPNAISRERAPGRGGPPPFRPPGSAQPFED